MSSSTTLFTDLSSAESADINGGAFTIGIDLAAWLLSPALGAAAGYTDVNKIADLRLRTSVSSITTIPGLPPVSFP